MNLLKIKLLVMAAILLVATSAFASLSYTVNLDTTNFSGSDGYLYLSYITYGNQVSSTATVSNFATDGLLGSQSLNVVNGSAVSGALPGSVTFANTNGINDYNHAIQFGSGLSFNLLLNSSSFGSVPANAGASTFTLALYRDELGTQPLLTGDGAGNLLQIDLNNDGTTVVSTFDASTQATPTPIPAAAWLFGSGLMGLAGLRRRKDA